MEDLLKKTDKYFEKNIDKLRAEYTLKCNNIEHDEPWVTLMAFYAMFNDQDPIKDSSINAFNALLSNCGLKTPPVIDKINHIFVEKQEKEIGDYRKYLYNLLGKENFHLYPDRISKMSLRKMEERESLEGNTNLDTFIEAESRGTKKIFFIEAKFLSDISTQITYNPVRDQIARNIDAGLDNVNGNHSDFYFLLLTPKVFRTEKYGGNKSSALDCFNVTRSRLYCYKMDDYKNPALLKKSLPHRKYENSVWSEISNNIGWITYDDMYKNAVLYKTINNDEQNILSSFFNQRNLAESL